jgi:O-antigen biosynthesis protein
MRIATVMLTFNQRETTLAGLRSLLPQVDSCDRVVVWDNGSADDTVAAIAAEFPSVVAHHHAENLGVAGGRNAGAALARSLFAPRYLLFLDNDLVLQPGFVGALLAALEADPAVGQVQGKLLYMDEPDRINDGGGIRINFVLGSTLPVGLGEIDRGQHDQVAPCVSCGGAMLVRADLFRQLGGFDEIFSPVGPEDIDFSLRLQATGHKAIYDPRAVALHKVSHTYESGGYSAVYARAKAKHWLRFLARHGSPMEKAGFFLIGAPLIAGKMVFRELLRGNPGAITGSLRGMFEALRGSRR